MDCKLKREKKNQESLQVAWHDGKGPAEVEGKEKGT